MSLASPPAEAASAPSPALVEGCPLCTAPLRPEQDWCLQCGAAARTRLAAAPGWRLPLIALGLVIVLALGALTAALVELAGAPPSSTPLTRTVTTPAAALAPGSAVPTSTLPTSTVPSGAIPPRTLPTSTAPANSVPTLATRTPRTPTATRPTLPGANVPGSPSRGSTPKR